MTPPPPLPAPPSATRRLGWYHFRLEVPEPWEVVGYKTNPRDGEVALADRRGQALRVCWKTGVPQPAPLRRLVQVARGTAGEAASETAIRERVRAVAGWQAYFPEPGDARALACRHEPVSDALLYAVFPAHPDTAAPEAVETILGSFAPNAGPERLWAAFGLDVTLPAEYDLARVEAYPAAQVLRFENGRGESVTAHRYGLLALLLQDQDMATFFARRAGASRQLRRDGEFLQGGRHPGVRLAYTTRGRGGLEGFMARTWQGRVWLWRCDELERLYAVDQNARADRLIADLPERVRVP